MTHDASFVQPSTANNPSAIDLHGRTFVPYISADTLATAVKRIAGEIERDYAGHELTLLIVLKGALVFAADLLRQLKMPVHVEFIRASSYRDTRSSGNVTLDGTLECIRRRDVLIIEDIADTGKTLDAVVCHIKQYEPTSVAIATLLSKPTIHNNAIPLRYVGIEIEPVFVVGYGLDYNELGRNLPSLYRLVE